MKMKKAMIGMILVISILTSTGSAQELGSSSFFTLYGQVSDSAGPVNGAAVSLTINGVTKTAVTETNSRGEAGFYQFELANFPDTRAGIPMTLSATASGRSVTKTISRAAVEPQRKDINTAPEGDIRLSVDAGVKSTVANIKATYTLVITNPGDDEETYDLSIGNPQNAVATLNMAKITLGAGMSGIILLDVTGATAGDYTVKVSGTYPKSPTFNKTANITTITKVYPLRGKIIGDGYISTSANFTAKAVYPNGNIPANGIVDYRDLSANLNIKSIQINIVGTTLDTKSGVITGLAQVNGAGFYYFEVYAEDNGISGIGDVFRIYLPTFPYANGAVLSSGNINIAKS